MYGAEQWEITSVDHNSLRTYDSSFILTSFGEWIKASFRKCSSWNKRQMWRQHNGTPPHFNRVVI